MKKDLVYTVIGSEQNNSIDALFEIYRNNPYNARVIFMNNNKNNYVSHRLVVFEENKTFNIVLFRKTFGISKTNRIYNRESRIANISYKNNKFYIIANGSVKPLTHRNILTYFHNFNKEVVKYLSSKFTWLNYMMEKNILLDVAFNTIISKKLYSYKKAIIHLYDIPYPIGKKLHELGTDSYNSNIMLFTRLFKKNLEYMDNITSLDVDFIKKNFSLFSDTLRMAKILNYKVNCKWKLNRLKEMHDKWSEKITDITFIDSDREMRIHPIFISFESFSGFNLLKTTKEMCLEGKKNNHCVATYVNKVESNYCGIYHVDGYTLEVTFDYYNNKLSCNQFRGYRNCDAPIGLSTMVKKYIDEYNEKFYSKVMAKVETKEYEQVNELPF